MSHQVVYRKYRSQNFSELIGQDHIAKTLSNQILNDSIGHAYLFFGPRGCGKTSSARIFAKTVNCLNPQNNDGVLTPCEECESCKNFTTDDMDIIEMDAASNRGIDDARLLRDKAYSQPIGHKYKVIILDEAHMLTREAVNALLKIIEEPPIYMIFVFCTTEFHKIPVTIASRCQRFKFLLAKKEDLIKKLRYICEKEGKEISDEELGVIATIAKGSFRDSESLLEQVIHSEGNSVKDLFSLYSAGANVSDFVNAVINDDIEKIWNVLLENEEAQNDVKQLLDISLDQAKLLLETKAINFNQYLDFVKVVGSFRTGTKEDFIYKYMMLKSPKPLNPLPVNQNNDIKQQEKLTANYSENIRTETSKIMQSPVHREIPKANIPASSPSSNNATTEGDKELNVKNIIGQFKDRPVIYNMLTKSTIRIEEKIIYIDVTNTVSKMLLVKNKVNTILLSYYQGEINDVKIDVVKNNISASAGAPSESDSSNKESSQSSSPEDIEKLFGSKFQ